MFRHRVLFLSWLFPCLAHGEEPVTITVQGATRPQGELQNEPYVASSRVQGERLASPGARASDLLRGEVGVQVTEGGGLGAPATASIRGATAAQTPVYLGGIRLNDQVGGAADLSTIPLWLIQRVDVYRGNAPFEADELGIGGALWFEPRRPRRPEAAASATLGSFGTRAGFAYAALGDDDAGVLAGLAVERAENDYPFADDRGTLFDTSDDSRRARSNSDSRVRDVWLLARARPTASSRLELTLNDVHREQGVPKLALVPSRAARAELSRTLAALSARLRLGSSSRSVLTLRSAWLSGASNILDPQRELGTLSERTELRGRRVSQRVALELPLLERVSLAVSGDGEVESLHRLDAGSPLDAQATILRGATRVDWQLGRGVALLALISAQCRATQPGGAGCEEPAPTGRVGAGYRAAGFTAFANLSRYQRQPTLGELYGAGLLVRGNPDLRSELGISADAGVRGSGRHADFTWRAEASAFVRRASELVSYARAAQGYVVPVNVGRARVAGLELGFGLGAFEHLELSCNVTLLDPRATTPDRRLQNDYLPFMSRLVLAPRLLVTTGERLRGSLRRAELSADLVYLSNRFADAAGLIVVPDQATLGLSAAATWLSGALISRLRLANALDTPRFDIVGYPLPGRSVYASLELRTP